MDCQTIRKFSCDEHNQVTESFPRCRPQTVTLPLPAHIPIFASSPPTILILQMVVVGGVMDPENVSCLLQHNMDYSSRKERGAWSLVIIVIVGTFLHGRNID